MAGIVMLRSFLLSSSNDSPHRGGFASVAEICDRVLEASRDTEAAATYVGAFLLNVGSARPYNCCSPAKALPASFGEIAEMLFDTSTHAAVSWLQVTTMHLDIGGAHISALPCCWCWCTQ